MTKKDIIGFLIDLATVVIGIALTFGSSELIQQRTHRKEASRILSMVKEELQENLAEIEVQKDWLVDEQAGTIARYGTTSCPPPKRITLMVWRRCSTR